VESYTYRMSDIESFMYVDVRDGARKGSSMGLGTFVGRRPETPPAIRCSAPAPSHRDDDDDDDDDARAMRRASSGAFSRATGGGVVQAYGASRRARSSRMMMIVFGVPLVVLGMVAFRGSSQARAGSGVGVGGGADALVSSSAAALVGGGAGGVRDVRPTREEIRMDVREALPADDDANDGADVRASSSVSASSASQPPSPVAISLKTPSAGGEEGAGAKSVSATDKYAVVIDAGSTGSRVHVFEFDAKDMRLRKDTFEAIKPGLSAYADDANAAADSLKALMKIAMDAVPESARATTSIQLRATAGLRLLPGQAAKDILAACAKLFASYPFMRDENSISIMDGADEGAYQWLTMNYLLGNLAPSHAPAATSPDSANSIATVAAVDLGGGSVQFAYQVTPETARKAPNGYVSKLQALGSTFDVYTRSHLGHGLMAARAAILNQSVGKSPCIHEGHAGKYEYAGKAYDASAHEDGIDHELCTKHVVAALELDKSCDREGECSFNGAWGGEPGPGSKRVYLSSYLWDRAVNVGIVTDQEIDGRSTVRELGDKAKDACALSLTNVTSTYHGVDDADAPFMCMDLTFAHALLSVGFKRHEWDTLTLVKQIEYGNKPIEAAWPLGAALNSMA